MPRAGFPLLQVTLSRSIPCDVDQRIGWSVATSGHFCRFERVKGELRAIGGNDGADHARTIAYDALKWSAAEVTLTAGRRFAHVYNSPFTGVVSSKPRRDTHDNAEIPLFRDWTGTNRATITRVGHASRVLTGELQGSEGTTSHGVGNDQNHSG